MHVITSTFEQVFKMASIFICLEVCVLLQEVSSVALKGLYGYRGGGVEVLVKEAFESLVSNRPLAFLG